MNWLSNWLMNKLTEYLSNEEGDMAEKTLVWVAILVAAALAFMTIGDKIVAALEKVADKI